MSLLAYKNYLAHHGIKGQKWGIRRYQNEDGSLTSEGKKRYDKNDDKDLLSDFESGKYGYEKKLEDGRYLMLDVDEWDSKQKDYIKCKPSEKMLNSLKDYKKNYKMHNDIAKKAIKSDFLKYRRDYGIEDDKQIDNIIKNLKPASTRITLDGLGEISYFDDTLTNHWFDVEYDFKNKKAGYVSMNG